jgi:TonB family protein
MAKMKQDIQKKWAPPKGLENRHVTTVFTILRDGTIVNPTIVDSSGDEDIDKAALQALHNASPLDALPLGAPKSVQIKYQFDWRVSRN